jgi:hypothetical protein
MFEYIEKRTPIRFALTTDKTLFGYWYKIEAWSGECLYIKEFQEDGVDQIIDDINRSFHVTGRIF